MAKSINEVTLVGNIGSVDVYNSQKGNVIRISVATSEGGYQDKNGQQVPEKTSWHNVVVFGFLADNIMQQTNGQPATLKGSHVMVLGKLTYDEYTDKNGQQQTRAQIIANEVISEKRVKAQSQGGYQQQGYQQQPFPNQNYQQGYSPFNGQR